MRRYARASLILLAIYVLVISMILGCGLTSRLLLYPPTGPLADTRGAERFVLPSSHGEFEVWRGRSASVSGEPEAFVLRFYGNADRADHWAADEARALPFAGELPVRVIFFAHLQLSAVSFQPSTLRRDDRRSHG